MKPLEKYEADINKIFDDLNSKLDESIKPLLLAIKQAKED